MYCLEYQADWNPRRAGQVHGERLRAPIVELAKIRLDLTIDLGGFAGIEAVRDIAGQHLAVLEQFDQRLYEELLGIAEGAGLLPADILVLNHYTDLRDLGPARRTMTGEAPEFEDTGGCTMVWSRASDGPVLAQSWDMHGSAKHYMCMLRVPRYEATPAAWLLSLTGCLGMAGINELGVAVGINNLHSKDATVGIVWSALVRAMLKCSTAREGFELLMSAPIGSGHHYMIADASDVFAIETSGQRRSVLFRGEGDRYHHTNHCIDDAIGECTRVPPTSTTYERYDKMSVFLSDGEAPSAEQLWSYLGSHDGFPRSICTHLDTPEEPNRVATCGGALMHCGKDTLWAVDGCMHDKTPSVFKTKD